MKKILIILLGITLSYSSFALDDDVKTLSKGTGSIESAERTWSLYNYNKCIIRLLDYERCVVFLHSNPEDEYFIFDESTEQVFKFSVEDYPDIFAYRDGPFFIVNKSFFKSLSQSFENRRGYLNFLPDPCFNSFGTNICWRIGIE